MNDPVADFFISDQAFWRSKTSSTILNQVVKILLFFLTFAELANYNIHFWLAEYQTIPKKEIKANLILYVCLNIITVLVDYLVLIKEHFKFVIFYSFVCVLAFIYEIKEAIEWENDWIGMTSILLVIETLMFIIFGISLALAKSNTKSSFDVWMKKNWEKFWNMAKFVFVSLNKKSIFVHF